MIDETDVLRTVPLPVFVLNEGQDIMAWNQGMETVTGFAADQALGRPLGVLLGVECGAFGDGQWQVPALGLVTFRAHGSLLVGVLSDHEREEFLGMAAHDLRAPLRNILFLAEEALHDADAAGTMLSKIKQVARQGIALTNDVVSCAQATGMSSRAMSEVELAPLCEGIFATLDAEENHDLAVMPVSVLVEKPVVQIALRNLLDNALRHGGGRHMKISVFAEALDESVLFRVQDNGAGFADPARAFLAGGEFRLESGYGLVGVRRLIRARGGSVSAAPNDGGPGSEVRFSLPGSVIGADRVAIAS